MNSIWKRWEKLIKPNHTRRQLHSIWKESTTWCFFLLIQTNGEHYFWPKIWTPKKKFIYTFWDPSTTLQGTFMLVGIQCILYTRYPSSIIRHILSVFCCPSISKTTIKLLHWSFELSYFVPFLLKITMTRPCALELNMSTKHMKKKHKHSEHLEKCKWKSRKREVCRRLKEIRPPKCVAFNKALFWERVIQPQSTTIKIVPAKVKCLVGRLVGLRFGWYCSIYASLIHSICVSIKPLSCYCIEVCHAML